MVQINATLNQNVTRVRKICLLVAAIGFATLAFARTEDKDIMDKLVLDPSMKTFTNLIVKAGLVEAIKAEGPITVFAPNDAAFAKLPPGTLEAWKKDRTLLRKILNSHIVAGKLLSKDMKEGATKTLSSEPLAIKLRTGLTPTINGTRMTLPDIEASNGAMHVVGVIFLPPAKLTKSP